MAAETAVLVSFVTRINCPQIQTDFEIFILWRKIWKPSKSAKDYSSYRVSNHTLGNRELVKHLIRGCLVVF